MGNEGDLEPPFPFIYLFILTPVHLIVFLVCGREETKLKNNINCNRINLI